MRKRWQELMLEGRGLACRRGGRLIFADLSFSVRGGEMLALRGPNGVGKTTLLRLIAGFLRPAAGTLALHGGEPDEPIATQSHYVAHQNANKPQLTAEENLAFWCDFLGGARENIGPALAALNLEPLRHLPGAVLSAGQKRRLALARLLLAKRPVWLLDEPTVGLDADSVAALSAIMRRHLEEGGIIIASTHIDLGLAATRTLEMRPAPPPEEAAATHGEEAEA
jgi:heme exporter protein A